METYPTDINAGNQEKLPQKPVNAITKGVVISLLLIVLGLAFYYLDIDLSNGLQYLFTLIAIGGIVWAVVSYGKQIDYDGTFGKYFSHGFAVTAIVTLLMIAFTLVELYLIPGFKEDLLQKSAEQAAKSQQDSKATQEQMQAGMEFFKKHMTLFIVGGTLLSYVFFGTIGALIGAAVTKKNPKPIFD